MISKVPQEDRACGGGPRLKVIRPSGYAGKACDYSGEASGGNPGAATGPPIGANWARIAGVSTVSSSLAFPAPPPSRAPAHAPAGERGSGRILVVDDNPDAAQTLAELLQVIGYEARTAPDAEVALQVLRAFRPQLALLDIGLPQVDGYQLAGLIRQQPEGKDLRLVALTGYGQESDRARALAAQFDEHLVKPVGIEQLTEVLQRFL